MSGRWKHKVLLKFVIDEIDENSIDTSGTCIPAIEEGLKKIADILEKSGHFEDFDLKPFRARIDRKIFQRYGWEPVKHFNMLMEKVYSYADENSIWIQ